MTVNVKVFWNVTPCSLVDCFSWRWIQQVHQKRSWLFTKLHEVTSQRTVNFDLWVAWQWRDGIGAQNSEQISGFWYFKWAPGILTSPNVCVTASLRFKSNINIRGDCTDRDNWRHGTPRTPAIFQHPRISSPHFVYCFICCWYNYIPAKAIHSDKVFQALTIVVYPAVIVTKEPILRFRIAL